MALRNAIRVMLAILLGMVALACGTAHEDVDEQIGQVELTLSGADGDGNTWKLPAGTKLYVTKGKFEDNLLLDGNAAVATFSLPIGMFEWELWNLDVAGDAWPLEREDAQNNVEVVMATLDNPQPGSLLVLPQGTTSLSLQFHAAHGGTISFVKGEVSVDLQVTTTEETGGDAEWGGVVEVGGVTHGAAAPPSLATVLPDVGQSFEFTVGASVSGAWEMGSSSKACAPVIVSVVGSGSPGFQDLLVESASGVDDGWICVDASGAVELFFQNGGAPGTSTFTGLGSTYLQFGTDVLISLPVPAFDGQNLDLSLLSGVHTTSATVFSTVESPLDGGGLWYLGAASGRISFSFTPAPEP